MREDGGVESDEIESNDVEVNIQWIDFLALQNELKKIPGVTVTPAWNTEQDSNKREHNPEKVLQDWRATQKKQGLQVVFNHADKQSAVMVTQYVTGKLIWSTEIRPDPRLEGKEKTLDVEKQRDQYLKNIVGLMTEVTKNSQKSNQETVIELNSIKPADPEFVEKTKLAFLGKFGKVKYEGEYYVLDAGRCVKELPQELPSPRR